MHLPMSGRNKKKQKLAVRLVFILTLLSFLTSCDMGKPPTRATQISSVPSDLVTETTPASDGTTGEEGESMETEGDPTIKSELSSEADYFMQILQAGNIEETSRAFRLNQDEMLPETYTIDSEIYKLLYTHLTYNYGVLMNQDYTDYMLDVTMSLPDLISCVSEVRGDVEFMNQAAENWILALDSGNAEDVMVYYRMMQEDIILEAIRRIEEGEYTQTKLYTDFFTFHDNQGSWLVTHFPAFADICARDRFLKRLGMIDPIEEFQILENSSQKLVDEGKLTAQKRDALINAYRNALAST